MEISSVHQSGPEEDKHLAEIKPSRTCPNDDQRNRDGDEIVLEVGDRKRSQDEDGSKDTSTNYNHHILKLDMERSSQSRSSSSAHKEQANDELESTKAQMDRILEENHRLKMYLDQILNDYRSLQMQYNQVLQQKSHKNKNPNPNGDYHAKGSQDLINPTPGLSLNHGNITNDLARKQVPSVDNATVERDDDDDYDDEGLTLALNCKFNESKNSSTGHENSVEEIKKDANTTSRGKAMKNAREDSGDIDEISQENPNKRARVSVRVRCDSPTMNDGCHWRKYGQKISKGNPCPRAYYRCTIVPSCPVRKQVQRCVEDMSILITTYEGTHNHPLPASATAMASTTSAAVSMLLSGSSTSGTGTSSSPSTNPLSAPMNPYGLNLHLSDNSRSKPLYLPNSSISSSNLHSHPTITLDLTSSSLSNLIQQNSFPPRFSTTNLNFSSAASNPTQVSWTNRMLSYGPQTYNMNQTTLENSLSFGAQKNETLYQSYLQNSTSSHIHSQSSLPHDTIAAATKAITSDPNFQSAIAAAITSIIGSGSSSDNRIHPGKIPSQVSCISKENHESFPILSSFPPISSSNLFKSAPSFLNMSSSSTTSQQSGLTVHSPSSLPFPNLKCKPNSESDKSDQV